MACVTKFFEQNSYDVIAMSETWQKPQVSYIQVNLFRCNLLRHDRVERGDGEIGIYVRERMKLLTASSPDTNTSPEYMFLSISRLTTSTLTILLAIIYHSPKSGHLHAFHETFKNLDTSFTKRQ